MNKTIEEIANAKRELQDSISSLLREFIKEHGGDDILRLSSSCNYVPAFGSDAQRFLNFTLDVNIECPA
jgi:hypothetical protein